MAGYLRSDVRLVVVALVAGLIAGPMQLTVEILRVRGLVGDYINLYTVGAFATGIAIAVTSIVFMVFRTNNRARSIAWVVFGVCLATAVFTSSEVSKAFSVGCAELQSLGEEIVADIEEYQNVANNYPDSLVDTEINVPDTRYGPWMYQTEESGYSLRVGDYGRDGLELKYLKGKGWYCDR